MNGRKVAAILSIISCVAASSARADDSDHVVINVVNGYVYVSVGTRDGAAEGDRLEVLDGGVPIGVLGLDLCGEVICRAPLGKALAGRVTRGMAVRVAKSTTIPQPKVPETVIESGPPKKKAAVKEPAKAEEPVLGPDVLPYREPIPAGYEVKHRRYSGLVSLGWVGFGVSYGLTTLAALGNGDGGLVLLLPVLGPLIYTASVPDYRESDSSPYILSSLVQAASVISLIAGYAGERRLVRTGSPAASVSFAPAVTREGAFFGVVGRF